MSRAKFANPIGDRLPEVVPYAQEAQRETGVPASLLLALYQEALDSDYTYKKYGRENRIILAIPAGNEYAGRTFRMMVKGYSFGHYVQYMGTFRAYDTWRESFLDAARYIASKRPSVLCAKSPDEACRLMGGFPSGMRSVRLPVLRRALEAYDLGRYDI